jgi:hypothetical protein
MERVLDDRGYQRGFGVPRGMEAPPSDFTKHAIQLPPGLRGLEHSRFAFVTVMMPGR